MKKSANRAVCGLQGELQWLTVKKKVMKREWANGNTQSLKTHTQAKEVWRIVLAQMQS